MLAQISRSRSCRSLVSNSPFHIRRPPLISRQYISQHATPPPRKQDYWTRYRKPQIRGIAIAVSLGVLFYVYNLERTPITGRWRFMVISPEFEKKLADSTYDQILRQYQGSIVSPNHPLVVEIRQIVGRLLEASALGRLKDDEFGEVVMPTKTSWYDEPIAETGKGPYGAPLPKEWRLLVVSSSEVNAFASYDTIVVFTGILPFCPTEDTLAGVIGHEIAHVVARHSSESLSSYILLELVAGVVDALLGTLGLTRSVSQLVLELPNSRVKELEADRIGVQITARACFDPAGATTVQRRLGELEKGMGKQYPSFLRTHPRSGERIQYIESRLPEAYAIRAESPTCGGMQANLTRFEAALQRLVGS
ncbi:peptidase family M48-domain-containing protein [Hysterangium stoloniferum]|nr:peptidase family M48-domain-containing protein [Hysterangium stoloniferum]